MNIESHSIALAQSISKPNLRIENEAIISSV